MQVTLDIAPSLDYMPSTWMCANVEADSRKGERVVARGVAYSGRCGMCQNVGIQLSVLTGCNGMQI